MSEAYATKGQPEDKPNEQTAYTGSVVHRQVSVKGSGGVAAKVVVIAQQEHVWVSIEPPFTGEAIMTSGKVAELMHTLGLAREDAQKMAAERGRRASGEDQPAVGEIMMPVRRP